MYWGYNVLILQLNEIYTTKGVYIVRADYGDLLALDILRNIIKFEEKECDDVEKFLPLEPFLMSLNNYSYLC